eukprot:6492799-Amphidinium_carterae.11
MQCAPPLLSASRALRTERCARWTYDQNVGHASLNGWRDRTHLQVVLAPCGIAREAKDVAKVMQSSAILAKPLHCALLFVTRQELRVLDADHLHNMSCSYKCTCDMWS